MSPSPSCVAFVTYEEAPALHPDDRLAADALQADGLAVEAVPWTAPDVRWERYAGVIVRSCWDYYHRPALFLEWIARLEAVGARLWNPPSLLRWNTRKRYLLWLAARGIPLIPTVWLEAHSSVSLTALLERERWDRAVVKPDIAANGYQTWRTSRRDAVADEPRFRRLLEEGAVIVQQFIPEVQDPGEWSFVFLRGCFSHAVLKLPAAGDFRTQADYGGIQMPALAEPGLVRQATRVADSLIFPWLYARVDGCVVGGELRLMELEVIEPSLYLGHHADAPRRFAQAIRSAIEER